MIYNVYYTVYGGIGGLDITCFNIHIVKYDIKYIISFTYCLEIK